MSFGDLGMDGDINTEDLMSIFDENNTLGLILDPVVVKNEHNGYDPNYNPNGHVEYFNIPPTSNSLPQHEHEEPNPQLEERLGINLPSQILSNEFSGENEFEIYINPHHGKKSPWMYSAPLSKIFIAINQLFPIEFKCHFPEDGSRLYVRATPIYSDTQHKNQLVTRCINHAQVREKTNEGCKESLLDHVIRCQDRNAVYGGSKRHGKHLYVRIPITVPAPGNDTSIMNFQFMCKNSCASEFGMNRRAMEVVFTLENEREEILGRRVLNVRVCSCPKRDKEAAEKAYYQRQTQGGGQEPSGKKRKLEKKQHSGTTTTMELVDEEDICILNIKVPANAAVRKMTLRAIHMALASEMLLNTSVEQKVFKKCINDIQLMQ